MTNAALRTPALLLPWLLALVACGSDATSPTPGDAPDAAFDAAADAAFDANAAVPDATAQEAGVRDASVSPGDSGTRDAGTNAARDAASDAARDAATPVSTLCSGAASAPFQPPTVCDALSGNTTTTRPTNAVYATSWFGCYRNAAGTLVTDPNDNCEFACGSRGLCASGLSGPECQAQLKWFAADADRFGCGTRIKVTNCLNSRAVVLAALDRGPNCRSVEQAYGAPVVDMSWPAMTYLFEGRTYGGSDKKRVVVEVVPATTALGPVN